MDEDSVEITIRAIDNASAVLRNINRLLSNMVHAVARLNRAFAAMQAPAFSNMFNSRTYNKIVQGLTAEQLALQRNHQLRLQSMRSETQQNLLRQRLHAEQSRRNQQVVQQAQKAIAQRENADRRAAASSASDRQRNWSLQAGFGGFSSAGGHARALGGMFGGGWTGLGGVGRALGTAVNFVWKLASAINETLWGAITKVFSMAVNLAQQWLQKLLQIGAVIGGIIVGGLAAIGAKSIETASSIQQTMISLTRMIGSQGVAKTFLTDMMNFAAVTPFNFFEGMMDNVRLLVAMKFELKDIKPMLTDIGDAVSVMGGDNWRETMDNITAALAAMKAKGFTTLREVQTRLAQGARIPALGYIVEALGGNRDNPQDALRVTEMISKKQISAAFGIQAILAGMHKYFGGAMERFYNSYVGRLNTLRERWKLALADMGEMALTPFTGLFTGLAQVLNQMRSNGTFQKIGAWFASVFSPQNMMHAFDAMARGLEVVRSAVVKVYDKMKKLYDFINEPGTDPWKNMGVIVGNLGDYIVQVFSWSLGKVIDVSAVYLQLLVNLTGNTLTNMLNVAAVALENWSIKNGKWFEGIGALVASIGVMTKNPAMIAQGLAVMAIPVVALSAVTRDILRAAEIKQSAISQGAPNPFAGMTIGQVRMNLATRDAASDMVSSVDTAKTSVANILNMQNFPSLNIYRGGHGAQAQTQLGLWAQGIVSRVGGQNGSGLPPWYNAIRTTLGEGIANGMIAAMSTGDSRALLEAEKMRAEQEAGNGLLDQIAQNTSAMQEVLGGGDRLKRLSARFRMYQPGELAAASGHVVTINLGGGTSGQQKAVANGLRDFARAMGLPTPNVRASGRGRM